MKRETFEYLSYDDDDDDEYSNEFSSYADPMVAQKVGARAIAGSLQFK